MGLEVLFSILHLCSLLRFWSFPTNIWLSHYISQCLKDEKMGGEVFVRRGNVWVKRCFSWNFLTRSANTDYNLFWIHFSIFRLSKSTTSFKFNNNSYLLLTQFNSRNILFELLEDHRYIYDHEDLFFKEFFFLHFSSYFAQKLFSCSIRSLVVQTHFIGNYARVIEFSESVKSAAIQHFLSPHEYLWKVCAFVPFLEHSINCGSGLVGNTWRVFSFELSVFWRFYFLVAGTFGVLLWTFYIRNCTFK